MHSSPKREVYKEWTKGSDIQLIMPLWEWYEMEKLVEQLYRGKVDLKRARENFEWYGGVPRLVVERPSYSSNESKDNKQALDAVATSNVVQVCTLLGLLSLPLNLIVLVPFTFYLLDPVCFRGGV